jgi:signal transduction histidine kinase
MCGVTDHTGRRAWAAFGLFGVVVVEVVSALVGVVVTGTSFAAARDGFMIPNAAIGVSCAVCGLLIAWNRPRNVLGWLLLGGGVAQTGTVAVTPWLLDALQNDGPAGLVGALATAYSAAWPWSVSLFIPLALLYFPDGRLPDRWWRWPRLAIVINSPLQVLLFSSDRNPLATVQELGPQSHDRGVSWLLVPAFTTEGWVQFTSDMVLGASFLAGLAGLVLRYRRGDERTRRQLLWLLLATTATAVLIVASRLPGAIEERGFPIILMTTAALIPIAMTIAVLRHHLLDIRLVWARAVTYLLLTAAVVAGYVGVVELADRLVRQQIGLSTSVLATLLVAAGFNPLRVRLQREVDRLLYGERADPVRAASSVIAQLAAAAERPADVLPALRHALRLPYAALSDADGLLGEDGVPPERVERLPLRHAGEQLGELVVGVRSGQPRLNPADRAVLELMAVPVGVALRAERLSETVQQSRRRIVAAREEERRRLRRDLHDGLGPALAGIAFQADAVVNLADTDPQRVRVLGEHIRGDVTGAITDVRRLIYQLRPSALDELGLVEALRRHAERLDRRPDGSRLTITVNADAELPELSAAVEVAAYRIVTEALTNVTRHSDASEIDVGVAGCVEELALTVQDNGHQDATNGWVPGIGLQSMHERAAELGGTVLAEPTPAGGRVHARLPLGADR